MGIWSNSKWSNSRNGNLRYSVNRENASGIYIGPTQGLSSPKNSRRGCLCLNEDIYHVRCCNGALQEQGIGNIQSPVRTKGGGFDAGYSDGFDIILNNE
jgi:hypothetical protein